VTGIDRAGPRGEQVPEPSPASPNRAHGALTAAFCVLFLTYAGCFLYFFVDDEAIPLIYARNLLRGRGLSYTVLEGRVEGYSDFLHVLWSVFVLSVTRAFHLGPLAPLVAGKGVSLAAGVAIVVCTAGLLARLALRPAARVAALVFLCLAGPLAVWSASSLETVVFALGVVAFAIAVWEDRLTAAVLLSMFVVLERIDGPIYLAAVLIGAVAARPTRWRLPAVVAMLGGAVVIAFHAWRYMYFGSLLSAPLATKVLFRFERPSGVMLKASDEAYFQGLLAIYGWPALMVAAAAILAARHAAGRMALAIVLLLGAYAGRIDDWMFGWRFAVAVLPFVAILLAVAIDRLPRGAAVAAAVGVAVWSGAAARGFLRDYHTAERRPIFWLSPRAGESAWLGRYYELLAAARPIIHRGDRISFNQAGVVPYVLDAENIDDLGICSDFIAKLPTTDVYYTGVGRYSPLTNDPVIRTAHAYVLYRDAQFLIAPLDLVLKANHDRVPDFVLDGAYQLADAGPLATNVIYRRTAKSLDRFARDPDAFTENVAHASRVVRVGIDGQPPTPSTRDPGLRFLRELKLAEPFSNARTYDITFAERDEHVMTVYVRAVGSRVPGTATIALHDTAGREVYRRDVAVGPAPVSVLEPLPEGTMASRLSLAIRAPGDSAMTLEDVRVEGQSEALRTYVRRRLHFSNSRMVQLRASVPDSAFASPPRRPS
jgi:hypothetical protein